MIQKLTITFFFLILLTGCGKRTTSPICNFLETATEQVKEANSINEIERINDKLLHDIGVYSMSLSPEAYEQWVADETAQKELQQAKQNYKEARIARENMLHRQ